MAQVPAADIRGIRAPAGTAATTGVSRKRAAEAQTAAAEFSALFASAQQARKSALRDRAQQAQETKADAREKTTQADKAPREKTAERKTRADALRESNAEEQAPDPSRADQMRDSMHDAPADERRVEEGSSSGQASSANAQAQTAARTDSSTDATTSHAASPNAGSPDAASGAISPQDTSGANLSGASAQAGSAAAQPAAANPFLNQQPATCAGNGTNESEPAGARVSGTTSSSVGTQAPKVVAPAAQVAVNTGSEEAAAAKGEAGGRAQSAQFEHVLDAATAGKTGRTSKTVFAAPKPEIQNPVNLSEADTLHELARVLRAASKDGHSTLLMRLDPPELGRVEVDVRMHGDVLMLRMEAQTPAGHEALQSKLADLRTALEQQGIQVGQVQVELRPPSSAMPQDTPPQQQSWQGGGQTHGDGTQRQGGEPQPGDGRPSWTRHAETTVEAGTMRGLDMVA